MDHQLQLRMRRPPSNQLRFVTNIENYEDERKARLRNGITRKNLLGGENSRLRIREVQFSNTTLRCRHGTVFERQIGQTTELNGFSNADQRRGNFTLEGQREADAKRERKRRCVAVMADGFLRGVAVQNEFAQSFLVTRVFELVAQISENTQLSRFVQGQTVGRS